MKMVVWLLVKLLNSTSVNTILIILEWRFWLTAFWRDKSAISVNPVILHSQEL